MKKTVHLLLLFIIGISTSASAQMHKRILSYPDVDGYKVLKCDFHQHTVFSDGEVWPTTRVNEAWEEDLDVIALTDHIEYRPHRSDLIEADHNRAWEIAKDMAKSYGITMIRSAEITRDMAPGHFNVFGIKDANKFEQFVNKDNWSDSTYVTSALREAKNQGAFILWNHPAFPSKDGKSKWYDMHQQLLDMGLMDGIEFINGGYYDSPSFQWAMDFDLTLFANTDVHSTMSQKRAQDRSNTMTLVLAKDSSEDSVMEALYAGRTAGICRSNMYGKEETVKAIVSSSVEFVLKAIPNEKGVLEIHNNGAMPYTMEVVEMPEGVSMWANGDAICLEGEVSALSANIKEEIEEASIKIKFKNVFVTPTQNLVVEFPIEIK